ncbi:DUF1150 family protein [Tanticharoenia sakaeratensis]|jgi:hypothetical protein|uniref:DUF1150 family protein n=2 Tax=Tanticharoenia TaxID=444052 RepID=A0A0D6MLJ0_9PROT|nr:hypothetical protein Tasa_017_179 [Tanticharoenia sakaeratensis NBRC 103193]GBQ19023.1 hypothetical protein AA103193_0888 [Tanticharoenia sakaeratensis NBRC 103193]
MGNPFLDRLNGAAADEMPADLRRISDGELRNLGLSKLAYVKSVLVDGEIAFAIHAADGTPMAVAGDEETALGAIVEHEMIPALVH